MNEKELLKKLTGKLPSGRDFTVLILGLIAVSAFVFVTAAAPNAMQYLRFIPGLEDTRKRRKMQQKLYDLHRSGYLAIAGGKYVLSIKGKKLLGEEDLWNLAVEKPKKWDGVWRIVLFDIPTKRENGRRALRLLLKNLGCFQYQKSVFIHPYNIYPQLEEIMKFYKLASYVDVIETKMITREDEVKPRFNL